MKIFKKLLYSIRSKISTNQRIIESGVEGGEGTTARKSRANANAAVIRGIQASQVSKKCQTRQGE